MAHCPECGAEMRQTRRGATYAKRGPAYVCPVAEGEVKRDSEGNLYRDEGAKHQFTRVYEEWDLSESADPCNCEAARGAYGHWLSCEKCR